MSAPRFAARAELAGLAPYAGGLGPEDIAARAGAHSIAKLGSNENPHPLDAAVREAMTAALQRPQLYPDPGARALARRLATLTGAAPGRILFGNGSEDLLNILARAVLRPGDRVATLYPSFPLHEDYATMMGAGVDRIPLTPDRRIDTPAFCAAAAGPVRLTVLANPMNPAGLWLGPSDLDALLAAQHPDSLLCLDEAYLDYAEGPGFAAGTQALATHDKPLLILRTFSKAHGLAALRIGYGLTNCDDLVQAMTLVRTPFNVNAVAQAAALATLDHPQAMQAAVAQTLAERARMAEALTARGAEVLPSRGNFLFVNTGQPSDRVADALIARGVIVKPWRQPGYDTFLRLSIGLPEENAQALAALSDLL